MKLGRHHLVDPPERGKASMEKIQVLEAIR